MLGQSKEPFSKILRKNWLASGPRPCCFSAKSFHKFINTYYLWWFSSCSPCFCQFRVFTLLFFHLRETCLIWYVFLIFFFFFFFRVTPAAYGSSQARGQIRAAAAAYTTVMAARVWDLSNILYLHCSSRQLRILNPPSKARDQTQNPTDTSWIHYSWATMGTPYIFLKLKPHANYSGIYLF